MKSQLALFVAVGFIAIPFVYSQGLGLPSREVLEERARARGTLEEGPKTGDIVYTEDDFRWPSKGYLKGMDVKSLEYTNAVIAEGFEATSTADKGTHRFKALAAIKLDVVECIASRKQQDLFEMIPKMLEFAERDTDDEPECKGLELAEAYALHSGEQIIRALSYHIVHEQGVVAADLLRQAVRLFGNDQLVDETAWDVDDPMPVDAAGIFILNPELAVEELKKRPVKRVQYFLANITEPEEFFSRYVGEGDGLEVLKGKYAANKAVIDAKHREVVAWLAAQPKE